MEHEKEESCQRTAPVTRPTDITNISYSVPTLKFHEIKSKDENLQIPELQWVAATILHMTL